MCTGPTAVLSFIIFRSKTKYGMKYLTHVFVVALPKLSIPQHSLLTTHTDSVHTQTSYLNLHIIIWTTQAFNILFVWNHFIFVYFWFWSYSFHERTALPLFRVTTNGHFSGSLRSDSILLNFAEHSHFAQKAFWGSFKTCIQVWKKLNNMAALF